MGGRHDRQLRRALGLPMKRRTSSTGKVKGSASRRSAEASHHLGPPHKWALPSGVGVARMWKGATGPVWPAHRARAGRCSTSRAPPTTDSAVHPSSVPGSRVAHGGDVLDGAGVGRGEEEHGQVRRTGVGPEPFQDLADGLAGGLGRERVLREPGGEGHQASSGSTGGRSVRGTTVVWPPSIRQWASMVP